MKEGKDLKKKSPIPSEIKGKPLVITRKKLSNKFWQICSGLPLFYLFPQPTVQMEAKL